jgi:hypothetical protein
MLNLYFDNKTENFVEINKYTYEVDSLCYLLIFKKISVV